MSIPGLSVNVRPCKREAGVNGQLRFTRHLNESKFEIEGKKRWILWHVKANANGKTLPNWFWLLFLWPINRSRGKISSFHKEYVRVEGRSFRTRGNSIERTWTASHMRKVESSRPWLSHIFHLHVLIFSLPVGEFFLNFWWQLRSIGYVSIPILKKFCRWGKI